jgi:hypothetical protein
MMHIVKTGSLFEIAIIICTSVTSSCFYRKSASDEVPNFNQTVPVTAKRERLEIPVVVPKGNEIAITVGVVGPRKAVVTLSNTTTTPVYLPYLSEPSGGFAYFINYELEEQNEETEEWMTFPPGDFGAGFHALGAGETIRARISTPHSGVFRIKVTYIVDRDVYEKMRKIAEISDVRDKLSEYDKISREIDIAQVKITSNVFRL